MKILGIFRGFPGLGRVVAGVSILETLHTKYQCEVKAISYLQGDTYLQSHGYACSPEVTVMDYCSIGLLPTNRMGVYIHQTINDFQPDIIIIDGEPLILQSIRISHPDIKIVSLLNPSDADNPHNDKEAMDYFNALYSLSDLIIIHGLREITPIYKYKKYISISTILRHEIIDIKNKPKNKIYCLLGGGTVNVSSVFEDSTIRIAQMCQKAAAFLPHYTIHIICSSNNIYEKTTCHPSPENVVLHKEILPAETFYSDASLIITRSGRNSLSELAYLGIPTISFITGDNYRKTEQEQNLKSLNVNNIITMSLHTDPLSFANQCVQMIERKKSDNVFVNGNEEAIRSILTL